MTNGKAGFLARYKKWIIAFVAIWVVLLGVLIVVGDGDQLPFQNQVF